LEWPIADARSVLPLGSVDRLITYTDFGLREVQAAFERAAAAGHRACAPPCDVVPHGVDTSRFFPLCGGASAAQRRDSRNLARARLFGSRPELRDAFIVLNANRNCPRKRIDVTLRAFARFARTRHDAWLYLHMGMLDRGVNVRRLARELGVTGRLLLTTDAQEKPEVSDERLNLIYNACDVGINTSLGEGWGLVAFEHAATGAAQIVPDHSACKELWRDAGVIVPVDSASTDEAVPRRAGLVAVAAAAEVLTRLYEDRRLREEQQEKAVAYATSPQFSWKNIARRWAHIFAAVLAAPNPLRGE
jgi:glycosyltransferase involved in cell wall biosynthesis